MKRIVLQVQEPKFGTCLRLTLDSNVTCILQRACGGGILSPQNALTNISWSFLARCVSHCQTNGVRIVDANVLQPIRVFMVHKLDMSKVIITYNKIFLPCWFSLNYAFLTDCVNCLVTIKFKSITSNKSSGTTLVNQNFIYEEVMSRLSPENNEKC